jgi:hypothetical protein
MRVRIVDAVTTGASGEVEKLCGSWGEIDVAEAIKEIEGNRRQYRVVFEDEIQLKVENDALVFSDSISSLGQLTPAAGASTTSSAANYALGAAIIFRLSLAVVCALFASMDNRLPVSLRWALGGMAMFAVFHLALSLFWFILHHGVDAQPQAATSREFTVSLLIPTAAAVIALVTGIGKHISLTQRVGVVAVAASILLGIVSASLQGSRRTSRTDRITQVLLINIIFFAFAFGLLCLAMSLAI